MDGIDLLGQDTLMLTITQVERETGLSKDVLRVWERRYGFPAPVRAQSGERLYDAVQVERLQHIKRLLGQGFRPGKLLTMEAGELAALLAVPAVEKLVQIVDGAHDFILQAILNNDCLGLREALSQGLARVGLQRFVQDVVPQLSERVGSLWAVGRLDVHQEHLYSEEISRLLRTAIGNLPPTQGRPRILLTTLPGEEHGLGLLMVEGVIAPEGVFCLSLGVQTPMDDIVKAVSSHAIDIVVLSFSVAFPARQALGLLRNLRARLPWRVEIWAGGGMTRTLEKKQIERVRWTPELQDCFASLADWRIRHAV